MGIRTEMEISRAMRLRRITSNNNVRTFLFLRRQFEREEKQSRLAWKYYRSGRMRSNYPYGEETLLDKGLALVFSPFCKCNILRRAPYILPGWNVNSPPTLFTRRSPI